MFTDSREYQIVWERWSPISNSQKHDCHIEIETVTETSNRLSRQSECERERNQSPIAPILPLTCPPISHHALQELREIHNKQQRQKQKELEADITQPPHDRKSTDLQESRYVISFHGYSLHKKNNLTFLTGINFVPHFPSDSQVQKIACLLHGEMMGWVKLPLLLRLRLG